MHLSSLRDPCGRVGWVARMARVAWARTGPGRLRLFLPGSGDLLLDSAVRGFYRYTNIIE